MIIIIERVEELDVEQGYKLICRFLNESEIDCYFGTLSGLKRLIYKAHGEHITDQAWQYFLTNCLKKSINEWDHSSDCLILVTEFENEEERRIILQNRRRKHNY